MFVLENPSGTESAKEKYLRQSRARSYAALNIHKRRRAGQKEQPVVNSGPDRAATYDPNQPTFATRPAPDLSTKKTAQRRHYPDVFRTLKPQSNGSTPSSTATSVTTLTLITKTIDPSLIDPKLLDPSDSLESPTVNCRRRSDICPLQLSLPPPITSLTNTTSAESRSLAFFREKTAIEWPSWHDAEFWRVLAPQACYAYPCVKHAIASIGAYHEGLTTDVDDEDTFERHKEFSFAQSKKALACLSRDYETMPISAILAAYTAIAAASTYMHDTLYWQAIRMQCNIIDSIRANQYVLSQSEKMYITHYLEPIIERQRSKAGQYIDLVYCLHMTPATHFYVPTPIRMPSTFQSLYHAESHLEDFLSHTTYLTKVQNLPPLTIPDECTTLHSSWLAALDALHSTLTPLTPEAISASILRCCANLGIMMIKTMHADPQDEMIFDAFTAYYAELRDTNRALLSLFSPTPIRTHVRFGIDVSWVTLIGNTASRWCRDPQIRADLIEMLRMCRRHEAIEAAFIWGEVALHAKSLEERLLPTPPMTCHDIPESNRVRINLTSFIWNDKKRVQQIQYRFYPYTDSDLRDFCVPHNFSPAASEASDDTNFTESDTEININGLDTSMETELLEMTEDLIGPDDMPQMIMGRGFTSWLKPYSKDEYHTIQNPNFYFPISRV